MSMEKITETRLHCDMDNCLAKLVRHGALSAMEIRQAAREEGWRKDKLGRDVCPAHPKLKGARRG
jgi:hypothetical protein